MAGESKSPTRAPTNPPIGGTCDPHFEAVRVAFRDNFDQRNEVGGSVCVSLNGKGVVDLWGGHIDAGRSSPWQHDTLINTFSVGKGVLAALVLRLAELGRLDFDTRVSHYWPEFAAGGKGEITLRTLLSHQAGLPAVREHMPSGAMLDWDVMCGALGGQEPYWDPGTRHGYHVNTYGYLVGEVVRRATGVSVGAALEEYLTGPLEADFRFGIRGSDHSRIAEVAMPGGEAMLLDGPEQWALYFPSTGDPDYDRMMWHAYFNPGGISGIGYVNSSAWREAEMPSTNGHGTARGVCAIYGALIADTDGRRIASPSLLEDATSIAADGPDMLLGKPSRFGLGFQLSQPTRRIGPSAATFGHYGYGGTIGFADPSTGVAFAYLMNRPGDRWQTPRTQALIEAVYESLGVSEATE